MTASFDMSSTTFSTPLVRARAKVLAREDREMKSALIRLRRERGLTQKQVADLVGVTQRAINKLERYDSDPKWSTIRPTMQTPSAHSSSTTSHLTWDSR